MTPLRTSIRRAILGMMYVLLSSLAALANCPEREAVTLEMLTGFETVDTAQRALRTALGQSRAGLTDGVLGVRTQQAVVDLCTLVPQPANVDLTPATVDVMQEYLGLDDALGDWSGRPFDRDLTAEANGDGPYSIGLSLAATAPITARALRNQTSAYACADITADLADDADAQQAIRTLASYYSDALSDPEICALLPAPADVQSVRDGFARLGRLEQDRPGSLALLSDADFLRWVDEQRIQRLRRLMASPSAVRALLDDYAATIAPPGATAYTGSDCTPSRQEKTGHFYVLTEDDIANIKTLISLNPILQGFAKDNPAFDSAGALWRDLKPVLEAELGPCILPAVEPLVIGPKDLPKTYHLTPDAAAHLSGLQPLVPSAAVLEEFQTRSFATKPEFMAALNAGLRTVKTLQINDQVAQIAETMAASAEPLVPIYDQPTIEIPPEDLLTAQTETPQLIVTEAADEAVQSLIDNPGLTGVLERSTINPAPNTEQIESQVRQRLADEVEDQITAAVTEQSALVEPFVVPNFGLSQPLATAITSMPYVRAAMLDSTGTELPDRLAGLAGVEYPSQRLFREALLSASTENGEQPFSTFVTERIIDAAGKVAPEALEPRDYSKIAITDPKCNCTPELLRPDQHVYGFFPFWHAPRLEERLPEGAEPDPLRQVDFGMISDLAFYGLEFTYPRDAQGNGTLQLNNTAQWQDAKRDFINTAHRFRAKADLAFDMRDWNLWSDKAVETAISIIVREIEPFERLAAISPRNIGKAIPTLFDPVRPDGITLLFPDYQGTLRTTDPAQPNGLSSKDIQQMINIIKGIYERLPDREGVRINVAFDFPIVDRSLEDPLLDDLFQLLVTHPYVLRKETGDQETSPLPERERLEAKVISKVLVFLERPTSAAKKGLRYRMEQGFFHGKEREEVLRSIIPILHPTGHREILQTTKANPLRTEPPREFSQFTNDVVYFQDNFAGIGFWPVPDSTSADLPDLKRIIAGEFNATPWLHPFTGIQSALKSVCDQVCPNRAAIMLTTVAAFVVMLVILHQSFYVGWVYTLGFRVFYAFGMVGAINVAVLLSLFALWRCDPFSTAPKIMLLVFVGLLGMVWLHTVYRKIKSPRKP